MFATRHHGLTKKVANVAFFEPNDSVQTFDVVKGLLQFGAGMLSRPPIGCFEKPPKLSVENVVEELVCRNARLNLWLNFGRTYK
jgi:hypothetical protein